MFTNLLKPYLSFNLILLFSFSVSVNTFVEIQSLNYVFYIFFHLSFIYFLFYHYHYSIYFIGLVYGVLLDILLLNEISSHLLSLILLISVYILLKKYLSFFSVYQINITIFLTLISLLFLEGIFAYFFNNIILNFNQFVKYLIISLIIFVPSIFIFNKID